MLNQETKRRIDSARDILVGKVPDPKAQVEQITTAMIYKFMDDMDKEAQELGGKARFFTNGYEKYSWTILMDPKLGGHERLNLYAEAVIKMAENPHIPQLFRDIFKDAFLPYRSPETLSLFLKEINGFKYVHSEDLGDAFEYLLSILGSQGDAGQFRTPRHIIDFIVDVVDPKKDETVLDPACGTAGFLISAFKHIQKQHKDKLLNPEDKKRMMNHIVGYDISPDMVKLSKVNMYLHGFPTPHIFEYDTLSSEDKWDETYDVIMANPPFMTPKGGIKPHKRFSVQANRAEVLFVNYIMEHLNINGRAGIIVPEGIIFQSGNAYKQLRKMLIEENYLYAVVSLPAGVFQPYSGVKTSILFLDKNIAKQTNKLLFVKVENDGFDLGAQRRPINENDLPDAIKIIKKYQEKLEIKNSTDSLLLENGSHLLTESDDKFLLEQQKYLEVPKQEIIDSGDWNLIGERYRESDTKISQKWPMAKLIEICTIQRGLSYSSREIVKEGEGVPLYNLKSIKKNGDSTNDFKYFKGDIKDKHFIKQNDIMIALTDLTPTSEIIGSPKIVLDQITACYSADLGKIILKKPLQIIPEFLYYLLKTKNYRQHILSYSHGANVKHLQIEGFYNYIVPLPSLEIQKKIIEEIDSYQRVINGEKQVVENWKFNIEINPEWKIEKLNNLVKMVRGPFGGDLKKEIFKPSGYLVYEQYHAINDDFNFARYFIDEQKFKEMRRFEVFSDDILISCSGTMGKIAIVPKNYKKGIINQALLKLTPDRTKILPQYLKLILQSDQIQHKYFQNQSGVTIQNVASVKVLSQIEIPVPPLEVQEQIVINNELQKEEVDKRKSLIDRFRVKIQWRISQIYQNLPHFNNLFLGVNFTDDFGWNSQWNEEIEKWLNFIEKKDKNYYQTHRNRARNPKQRDELLGEYKAAYIIEEKCEGKIDKFEPISSNSHKYDFSFKDKDNKEWLVEVKSPSWRSIVSKEIDDRFYRELKGSMAIIDGGKYPLCKAEIVCPSCKKKFEFNISNIESNENIEEEIKKLICSGCKKNVWNSSEQERAKEKTKRLSLPQFINAEGRSFGFDIFEEAIKNSLNKFEVGKNNLLILCPNSFSELGFFGVLENWHSLREMIKKIDKDSKLSCIGVFEISLSDKFKYNCSIVNLKNYPRLNNKITIYSENDI